MPMGNYLINQLLTHVLRTSSFTKPSTVALALVTNPVVASDTGATITEVANANNYSRRTINPSDSNWTNPSSTQISSNTNAVSFPEAYGSWGTIVGIAILDSSTHGAGNLLYYGTLSPSQTIVNGDVLTIAAQSLDIAMS